MKYLKLVIFRTLTVVALVTLIVLSTSSEFDHKHSPPTSLSTTLAFASPQQVPSTFDPSSAGMSVYLQTNSPLNTARLESLGSVISRPYGATILRISEVSYLYASNDGWLIAYLPSGEPTASMTCWKRGSDGVPNLCPNILGATIESAASALGIPSSLTANVKYYHWRFPDATQITYFNRSITNGDAKMSFTIPAGMYVVEGSWNYWKYNDDTYYKIEFSGTSSIIRQFEAAEGIRRSGLFSANLGKEQYFSLTGAVGGINGYKAIIAYLIIK